MSKEVIFSSKNQDLTAQECSQLLKEIAEMLLKGEIDLKGSNESVNTQLPERVDLDIDLKNKVKNGIKKTKLDIEISWKDGTGNSIELN